MPWTWNYWTDDVFGYMLWLNHLLKSFLEQLLIVVYLILGSYEQNVHVSLLILLSNQLWLYISEITYNTYTSVWSVSEDVFWWTVTISLSHHPGGVSAFSLSSHLRNLPSWLDKPPGTTSGCWGRICHIKPTSQYPSMVVLAETG